MKFNSINVALLSLLAATTALSADCPSQIIAQGYSCCLGCNVVLTDNDGAWGVENNNWCGIPTSKCNNLPKDCSTSIQNQGYVCCPSNNCDIAYTDNSGSWGIDYTSNSWCGISNSCNKVTTTTTQVSTPTTGAVNDQVDPNRKPQKVNISNYSSGVSVHDPSVVKANNKYYIFGSHMDTAYTSNLWNFTKLYTGVDENNRMFSNLFSRSNYAPFSYVGKNDSGGYSVWAPDVHYNKKMKKWVQYFCTTSTFIKSNLCYATADNVEGPYTYQGTFLYSGMVSNTVDKTNLRQITGNVDSNRYFPSNSYNYRTFPNAIDPSVFYDFNGKLWLTYGSWSGGIYILELDESTGLPKHSINNSGDSGSTNFYDKYYGKKLAGGNHQSIEGPYILPHKQAGYYYLFVSYGGLTSNGGYQIRQFRSKNPDGPYVDAYGKSFVSGTNSNYGVKVMGNYKLPGLSRAYMAPGHNSAMVDDNGKTLLFYHTRFDDGSEYHEPRVHQMFLNKEGWLVAAPYAYTGETISSTGYGLNDLVGTYQFLIHNHKKIDGTIVNYADIKLNQDFTVSGSATGKWSYTKGTAFMNITINNVTYSGVFVLQKDEAKSATVTSFTGVATTNDSIWGVRY